MEKVKDHCSRHKRRHANNYLAWHAWAEWMHKRGSRQTRCKRCRRYLFKCEY